MGVSEFLSFRGHIVEMGFPGRIASQITLRLTG